MRALGLAQRRFAILSSPRCFTVTSMMSARPFLRYSAVVRVGSPLTPEPSPSRPGAIRSSRTPEGSTASCSDVSTRWAWVPSTFKPWASSHSVKPAAAVVPIEMMHARGRRHPLPIEHLCNLLLRSLVPPAVANQDDVSVTSRLKTTAGLGVNPRVVSNCGSLAAATVRGPLIRSRGQRAG